MARIFGLIAFVTAMSTEAWAAPSAPVECGKVAGMIRGPMVPTTDVAREIYLAIAHGRGDKVHPDHTITIEDEGERWSVFQYPANPLPGQIVFGGGTLEMTISKCDGSVSAHYSR